MKMTIQGLALVTLALGLATASGCAKDDPGAAKGAPGAACATTATKDSTTCKKCCNDAKLQGFQWLPDKCTCS
jgi:hypothetical protein